MQRTCVQTRGAYLQSADVFWQLCQVVGLQCQLFQLTQVAQLWRHLLEVVAIQAELAQLTCSQSPILQHMYKLQFAARIACFITGTSLLYMSK